MNDARNGRKVLPVAGFGIDLLNGDERAFALHRFGQNFEIDGTITANRQSLRIRGSLQYAVMLNGGNEPCARIGMMQRQGRRLTCTRGEDDLAIPAERSLNSLARILQQTARLATFGVRTGGIGPLRKAFLHRRVRLRAQRGGGGMVEIDAFRDDTCSK